MKRYIYNIFLPIVILLAFWACEKSDDMLNTLPTEFDIVEGESSPYKVGFYAGRGATRTTMLSNGLTAEWVAGDKISLWAKKSDGTYALNNQVFKTFGIDSKRGFFTTDLSDGMPEDNYTYYCCYPVPVSVDGTTATFNIPVNQDGKATSGADIMIADPAVHGALTPIPEPEDHSGLSMKMNRMMHQFRFYIPSDNEVVGDKEITKLVLTFPKAVAGNVALDLADPSATSEILSDGSNKIVMNLAKPLTVSKSDNTYYACMVMNPTEFAEGQELQVKAYTATQIAVVDPIDLCGRNFEAGHSTPVKLKVKEIKEYPYSIKFTLAAINVGENPTIIKFTVPDGCKWEGDNPNVYTYAPGREIVKGEEITIRFEDWETYKQFSGKEISVEYDSENTLTYQKVKVADMPTNMPAEYSVSASLTVPYLLYQDFSGIGSYSDGHDNPTVGTGSDTYTGISELSGCGLNGWYGARVGVQDGTSLRICCRYEHVLLAGAYYKGRIYTPQLSGIKDGKDVKISVSFKYGSNRNERKPLFGSRPDKSPILYFGINTQDVVTNPDENEGDIIDQVTGLYGGSGYASNNVTSLSPMAINGEYLDKENGSYSSLPKSNTVTINNVDKYMRLGWILTTDNTASNTNANYWLYLDDIIVKIVK